MSLPNLFWKSQDSTKSLLATPFKTEEEFEKTVFETPEILEDIFFFLNAKFAEEVKPVFLTSSELIPTGMSVLSK